MFRRTLRIGRVDIRLTAAALGLATIPLGTEVAAVAQMAALVALMTAAIEAERRL